MRLFRLIVVLVLAYACFALGSVAPDATAERWAQALGEPQRLLRALESLTRGTPPAPQRERASPRQSAYAKTQVADAAQSAYAKSTPPADGCWPDRARAERAFAELNALRAEAGLSALAWDESAYAPALARAEDMVARRYFSHYDPDSGAQLAPDWGETLVGGTRRDLARAWRDSPPHWEIISQASGGAVGVLRCRHAVAMRVMDQTLAVTEVYPMAVIAVGLWR